MVASRTAREKKAGVQAGPLGRVRIDVDAQDAFVYKITCTSCTVATGGGRAGGAKASDGRETAWSTYRSGDDNGFMAAMDRWIFHLTAKHPDTDAPCLAYRAEAELRLHERRGSTSEA